MATPNPVIKDMITWSTLNRADFPWRHTGDPYRILVAEFMLHRTRAQQVVPIFNRFTGKYPDLRTATGATVEDFQQLLRPLGLARRAGELHAALRHYESVFGRVPQDIPDLLTARGVGQYIAGAVAVFSGGQKAVLVDTNVVRVVGRIHGIPLKDSTRRSPQMQSAIISSMEGVDPREFYLSLIDLAHNVCSPRNPRCNICPLAAFPCAYYQAVVNTGSETGKSTVLGEHKS